jgi:hypothetical protein
MGLGLPGVYDISDAIVGLTLAFLIGGYVWSNRRTVWQSLAVCSIVAGIAVPIGGYVIEAILAKNWLPGCASFFNKCVSSDKLPSNVPHGFLLIVWLVIFVLAFIADRWRQVSR